MLSNGKGVSKSGSTDASIAMSTTSRTIGGVVDLSTVVCNERSEHRTTQTEGAYKTRTGVGVARKHPRRRLGKRLSKRLRAGVCTRLVKRLGTCHGSRRHLPLGQTTGVCHGVCCKAPATPPIMQVQAHAMKAQAHAMGRRHAPWGTCHAA